MSGPPSTSQVRYNQVYETLVKDKGDLVGMIAYALYKQSKRDWLIRFEQDEGRIPDQPEFRSYVRAHGEYEFGRLRSQAENLLAQYSRIVLDERRAEFQVEAAQEAHRSEAHELFQQIGRNTRWYKSIWAGLVSAFCYSLLLIAAVLVFKWLGVDVLAALEKARPSP